MSKNDCYIFIHDIVEDNGRTIKENNLLISHKIPVGTLVEVKFDAWWGNGAGWKVHARLWVVSHDRDCDGSPLYTLSQWVDLAFAMKHNQVHTGFGEEKLTIIEITEELQQGENALEWEIIHI